MTAVTPANNHPSLQELERSVRAELVAAEAGEREPEAEAVPAGEQLPDPDAERYEAALRTLLGAVEAQEGDPRPGDCPPEAG